MIDEKNDAVEYDEYETALSMYSDAYKDAYGFRPRDWGIVRARFTSAQDIWNAIDDLQPEIDKAIRRQIEAEERAYVDWRARLNKEAEEKRVNFATALRWDFQAEGVELCDTDFYCYLNGLSYTWAVYIEEQLANG